MFSIKGKKAYITGGTSGIGLAIAERFVAAGAQVVVADIIDGTSIADEIGAIFVSVDVSNERSVKQSFVEAEEWIGKLDIVVLNAGVGDIGPTFEETEQDLLEKVTKINQWGVLYGLKWAPKYMVDGGSIISTSSMASSINMVGSGVYSAAKRAVNSMTEMSALELGSRGIRVNSVCPGYVDTALGSGDEGTAICESFTALGRGAQTDDLVGLYHFLGADESRYITGTAIKVDGGWSCGPTEKLLSKVIGSSHVK